MIKNKKHIDVWKKEDVWYPLFFSLMILILFIVSFQSVNAQNYTGKIQKVERPRGPFEHTLDSVYWTNKFELIQWIFNESSKSEKQINKIENRIETLENTPFSNHQALYRQTLAEHHAFLGIIHTEQSQDFASIKSLYRAYKKMEANRKQYPNYLPSQFGYHNINLTLSFLPKSLQSILKIFGFKPNEKQAIEALKNIYEHQQIDAQTKFEYEMLHLYSKNKFGLPPITEKLNYPVYHLLKGQVLLSNRKPLKALEYLKKCENMKLSHLLMGKSYFVLGNYTEAKKYLQKFIEISESPSNKTMAYYLLYQISIVENQDKNQTFYKEKTLTKRPYQNGKDRWARNEISYPLDKTTIILRNWFDQGNANRIILEYSSEEMDITDERQFYYYLRSFVEKNDLATAEKILKNWASKFPDNPRNWYYKPKGILILAQALYKKEPKKSLKLLEELENYNHYSYQKDIEGSAKYLKWQIENSK
ncbi:MAG: CDC27 family protein [Flavobacteriales bacterium]|jgi:hypothetical protein|nr:CDC27 family protein [Flavobacteriales bacterium]